MALTSRGRRRAPCGRWTRSDSPPRDASRGGNRRPLPHRHGRPIPRRRATSAAAPGRMKARFSRPHHCSAFRSPLIHRGMADGFSISTCAPRRCQAGVRRAGCRIGHQTVRVFPQRIAEPENSRPSNPSGPEGRVLAATAHRPARARPSCGRGRRSTQTEDRPQAAGAARRWQQSSASARSRACRCDRVGRLVTAGDARADMTAARNHIARVRLRRVRQ